MLTTTFAGGARDLSFRPRATRAPSRRSPGHCRVGGPARSVTVRHCCARALRLPQPNCVLAGEVMRCDGLPDVVGSLDGRSSGPTVSEPHHLFWDGPQVLLETGRNFGAFMRTGPQLILERAVDLFQFVMLLGRVDKACELFSLVLGWWSSYFCQTFFWAQPMYTLWSGPRPARPE